ncbi:molybdate ABC transporter substrate-binding protein [sulfur-oxidizing endosymbiont of Gigantopelta aegis]|uniref:molybdate ABC transporter substrate-binding protein n=1 Tax=sulfur-oxidizing endosymbiont of Gigantopelta aegis TaxID=2794934 RepID=UPI0018DCBA1F|nr:substrate-binding domain-containing protein [sulfur-oxidizing endosymbiont of Gigantopelta aegis]
MKIIKNFTRLAATTLMASAILSAPTFAAKDAGHGHDYRTFHADNKIDYGNIGASYTSDLVMYLAGNQFMVMKELIQDFQGKNSDIKTIYVETIPPGQILKGQILKQGEIDGQKTAQNPDLYASVNLGHLKKLKAKGVMSDYKIYTHNKLELMVAKGNPKGIKGAKDLGRDDLVQSHPNPLTEGIFKFYGSQMLKDLGLYEKVTAGKKCKGCWAIEGKTWFTKRHHRETPYRIENGQADVGIVWTSEVKHALAEGRKVEGVAIAAPFNMGHKVGYAIGSLSTGKNQKNASRFLAYLSTSQAQDIYAKYGFVKATAEDLKLKPIPSKKK